ncbi:hypothetical protein GOP47_0005619 [Adiantum capillus-veneris]|uniref:Uncharacterized protein n=1 Tax=Adiantum capillus-veneris TaxID=13818 RepID=A0A9D4ZPA8_ADICA|nr:hypothetical protein GOP47_0005619 [Adiantum capillus-veneris]
MIGQLFGMSMMCTVSWVYAPIIDNLLSHLLELQLCYMLLLAKESLSLGGKRKSQPRTPQGREVVQYVHRNISRNFGSHPIHIILRIVYHAIFPSVVLKEEKKVVLSPQRISPCTSHELFYHVP